MNQQQEELRTRETREGTGGEIGRQQQATAKAQQARPISNRKRLLNLIRYWKKKGLT